MKQSLIFLSFLLMWVTFSSNYSVVKAQSNDCPLVQGGWTALAAEIHAEYTGSFSKYADPLQRASALQKLRRCIDQQTKTPENEQAYQLERSALDLAVDSIISGLIADPNSAQVYLEQANQFDSTALQLIVTPPTAQAGSPLAGTITMPLDGASVAKNTLVRGTYDTNQLDSDHHLWLFIVTPHSDVYPQAAQSCPHDQRQSIPIVNFSDKWTMAITVGSDGDIGQPFRLLLVTADAAANDFLNNYFDQLCTTKNLTSLKEEDLFNSATFKINVLEDVTVVRQ